jgi:hypothetical protein
MNPLIQLQKTTLIFLVALACFGLSPMVQALLPPPPPDGGYPNENTAEGDGALFSLTDGVWNTALGFNALTSNTTGNFNTAVGTLALESNTTGDENTATGDGALSNNTTGFENTATGVSALLNNTTGFWNTATGSFALASNTTGSGNTATGLVALQNNTIGESNTATGVNALFNNTSGNDNTAVGAFALFSDTSGRVNTANDVAALFHNRTGERNTAIGTVFPRARLHRPRPGTTPCDGHKVGPYQHNYKVLAPDQRLIYESTKANVRLSQVEFIVAKITRNQVSLKGGNANRHDNTIETVSGRVHVLDVPADKPKEVADLVSTTDGLIVYLAHAVPANSLRWHAIQEG